MEAAAILIAAGPDEYYMGGGGFRIAFTANTPGPATVGLGIVQEGKFVDGKWVVVRQLGGDDIGQGEILSLRPNTILRVVVYRYEYCFQPHECPRCSSVQSPRAATMLPIGAVAAPTSQLAPADPPRSLPPQWACPLG
jgi:hypothetical protein